jgi:predicted lipoprotein with Yx(FWY)xxD motif
LRAERTPTDRVEIAEKRRIPMKTPMLLLVAATLAGCETVAPPPIVVLPTAAASLTTATKAPFGTYVVDGAGRALYVLEGTRGASGVNRCNGACLGIWPPLMTAGPTVAAAGVDPALVGAAPGYGGSQATYAGWPLYYYHHDAAPADTTGENVHDQWGVWYLLAPSGEPIRPAGGY